MKNLVSSAIGEDTSPVKTASTSPGTRVAAPTLTHLLELPLNSPGKPLPELTVAEETEISTALSSSKGEAQNKSEELEAESVESAKPSQESAKTEQVSEPEPMVTEVTFVENQVETVSTSNISEETQPAEKEISVSVSPEQTDESLARREAELGMKSEFESDVAVQDDQSEIAVAFENEVEISHGDETEKVVEEGEAEVNISVKEEPVEEEEATVDEDKRNDEVDESSDEKNEEKDQKAVEAESTVKSEPGTPIASRRPQRTIRKTILNRETDGAIEDKGKVVESGPTTRRSSGRKGTNMVSDEHETEVVEEAAEAHPSVGIGKKKTSLPPPVYIPSSSPAPSSGIDSTPNSPTSSVSTVA